MVSPAFRKFASSTSTLTVLATAWGLMATAVAQQAASVSFEGLMVGDQNLQGSMAVTTSPAGWEFSTNATGWQSGTESFYFAATSMGESGNLEWQSPDAEDVPADGVAGIMVRSSSAATAGSPFIFVGVRQGVPGVELVWRSQEGQDIQQASTVISATDFPDGSRLRLEWVRGRAFLSYQQGGTPAGPWIKRLAIELGDPEAAPPGTVQAGLAFASASSMGSPVAFTVGETDVAFVQKIPGARWMRVVEPFDELDTSNGVPGTRLSHQGFSFISWGSATSTIAHETGPAAALSTGGDHWKMELNDLETESWEFMEFTGIPTLKQDVVDLYIRLGTVDVQTALPELEIYRAGGSPTVSSSLSSHPLGAGVWEFVCQLPAVAEGIGDLYLSLAWNLLEGSHEHAGFDSLLLAGQGAHPDSNADGLPDGFGGAYAHLLRHDGDFDADGWTNLEEFFIGWNPLSASSNVNPVLSREGPLSDPWWLARGRWSAEPAEVKVVYPGGGGVPVKGYPVLFEHSSSAQGRFGFGAADGPAPLMDGGYIALTDAEGVARARVWTAPECPLLASGAASYTIIAKPWSTSSYNQLSFAVRPYDNGSPGPVEVLPEQETLALIGTVSAQSWAGLVVGNWKIVGEPNVPAEGVGASPTGRVALYRWNSQDQAWKAAGFLPSPSGLLSNGQFGSQILHDSGWLAVRGGGKIHFYRLAANGESWQLNETPLTMPYGYGELKGLKAGWLAVGTANAVSLFKEHLGGWSFVVTLDPASGGEGAGFGLNEIAFSEDASRLVVAAPSNPAWFADPANAPYEGQIYSPIEMHENIWDWVMDEYGNMNYVVVGYTVYWIDNWLPGTIWPTPPPLPSVYVFERSGSTWSLTTRLEPLDTMPSPPGYTGSMPVRFGSCVAAPEDWVLVGAPSITHPENLYYGWEGSVIGYRKNTGTNTWEVADRYYRANPTFGSRLATIEGVMYAEAANFYHPGANQDHIGFVEALAVDASEIFQVAEIQMAPNVHLEPVTNGSSSLWLRHYVSSALVDVQEFRWLPTVSWDDPEETTLAGWATIFDANLLSGVPATELVTLFLASPSSRWDLTAPLTGETAPGVAPGQTPPLAVRVKEGAALADIAPAVDWLDFGAQDMAGDTYHGVQGVRVRGEAPGTPEIESAGPTGRQALEISWEMPSHRPEVIVVEKAQGSYVQDWITNMGTPEQLDALFSEEARLDATSVSYTFAWTGSYENVAFRLKAANSEGASPPGEPVIVDLDSDDDGLPDWWESLYGDLNPYLDADGDGLSNADEFAAGTDPNSSDTDGDGRADGTDSAPLEFNANNLNFLVHTLLH